MKIYSLVLFLSILSLAEFSTCKLHKKIHKTKKNKSRKLMFDSFFDILTLIVLLKIVMPAPGRKLKQMNINMYDKKYWMKNSSSGRRLNQSTIRELLDQGINRAHKQQRKLLIKIEKNILPINQNKQKMKKIMKKSKLTIQSIKRSYTSFRKLLKVYLSDIVKTDDQFNSNFLQKNGRSIYKRLINDFKSKTKKTLRI